MIDSDFFLIHARAMAIANHGNFNDPYLANTSRIESETESDRFFLLFTANIYPLTFKGKETSSAFLIFEAV